MFDAWLISNPLHFDASASDGVCKYYGETRLFITQFFSFCHNVYNCYAPDHALMFRVVTYYSYYTIYYSAYSYKDVYHIFIVLWVGLKEK